MTPFVLLIVSLLYWFLVGRVAGVGEPWDAAVYWRVWYPASFIGAAIGGFVLPRRGWTAGAIVTFAQFPIMWLDTGIEAFSLLALALLTLLAMPVAAVATLAGAFAAYRHRKA